MKLKATLATLFTASMTMALPAPTPANSTALSMCKTSMNGALPSPISSDFHFSGNTRRYFIAAEEVTWDYVPSGWDNWLGVPIEDSPRANITGITAPGSLGTKWQKALYRGYISFSVRRRHSTTGFPDDRYGY